MMVSWYRPRRAVDGDAARGGNAAGSGTLARSGSPVRVKVTVRFAVLQLLVVDLVVSPDSVPSGCGCRVNTTQTSVGASLQDGEPRPTASPLTPTSAKNK